MPRKLKTQRAAETAAVPAPSPANSAVPTRAMKAVSTKPTSGSAIRLTQTGAANPRKARLGRFLKRTAGSVSLEGVLIRPSQETQ